MPSAADHSECQDHRPHDEIVSARRRLAHAAWSTAAIAALGWWSWYSDPDADLPEIMAAPEAFEGQNIKIGDEPVLEAVEPEHFVVRSRGYRLRVAGTVSSADVGRFIYVRGVFRRPAPNSNNHGVIEPAEHYVASGRRAKIWLSVIPVAWIAVLLLRHFRVNPTRLSIEPRS
jgi:hypothetical protein